MKRSVLIPVVILAAVLVAAPVYKWVDEHGRVHYSDEPPPSGPEAEEFAIIPPPAEDEVNAARARLDRLLAEQAEAAEEREAAAERRRLERELAEAERVQRLRRCLGARQNLHVLQRQEPVYRIDEKGEYQWLDDAERQAAISSAMAIIADNCD